ncbi:hypothetical protein CITRIK5_70755 [Citricoccus sp. K5]|nr:hypothetical protein CITRIK5_70755 [Citricoccus sp. K5]
MDATAALLSGALNEDVQTRGRRDMMELWLTTTSSFPQTWHAPPVP